MSEWHDYSEDNISYCQVCKDLYNDFKDEEAQLEDYHKIVPLSSKGKKKGIAATLEDFAKGAKLRLNKDYKGNSQLGAFDVVSDSDDEGDKKSTTSSSKATSSPTTSSPKATSSPKTQKNTVSKGGRRRITHSKKRRSHTKRMKSHSKKRRSNRK